MSSNGYLVPPSKDPSREELWNETWKRIDRFLPNLRADLALEEQPLAEQAPPPSAGLPPATVGEAEAPAEVGAEAEKAATTEEAA
jgi:brefeldin A-resistance guanine nucleotide exchange factor 1